MDNEYLILEQIASAYIDYIKKEEERLSNSSCLNDMLQQLPHLKLEKGYLLDDYRPRECDNSTLNLYVRRCETRRPDDSEFKEMLFHWGNSYKRCWLEKILDKKRKSIVAKLNPFDYITLPFTVIAIWEAYLLQQSWHLIGMRWHGYYEERIFINSPKDITRINSFDSAAQAKTLLIQQIYDSWNFNYYPRITTDKNRACIKHCWLDPWKGFVQVTCNIFYNSKTNKISKFEFEDEVVLIKYNCGFLY